MVSRSLAVSISSSAISKLPPNDESRTEARPSSTRLLQRRLRRRGLRLLNPARQQNLARDHEPLDLRRALVELHDLRVAHQLLDRVLLDEPVAAVDLDGIDGDLHRGVRGEALGV